MNIEDSDLIEDSPPHPGAECDSHFPDTEWFRLAPAAHPGAEGAQGALDRLCSRYWRPVYAVVRHHGHSLEDARDLTQEFFARFIQQNWLAKYDAARQRLRTFLIGTIENFLATVQPCPHRRPHLDWDALPLRRRAALEPIDPLTPGQDDRHREASAAIDRVLAQLRAEAADQGTAERFDLLEPSLLGETLPFAELAARLQTSELSLRYWSHSLRLRFGALLYAELSSPATCTTS